MLKHLANIISIVFHPLLMATLLIATLYFFLPTAIQPVNENAILPVLLMVFLLTYVLPLLSVGMLRLTNTISSLRLVDKRERLMPFLFITIYYAFATYIFAIRFELGQVFMVIFGSITLSVLLVTIITKFFKVSAHSVGTAGLIGFLLAFHIRYIDSRLILPLVAAFILHGIVSSARLYLHTHDPKEVHFGSLLGFIINFGAVYFLT
ncbi:hypothetical protein C900_03992 [Fulvivirga imtechensis AK7]|uniref:Transmembrane protein n=2 Tax=Fulvivirga TaxID=396811 RepID=L8JSH4_9BACT|nr:hypothetical protein C900_03992 [Fulvivirga imtechensis AK7]